MAIRLVSSSAAAAESHRVVKRPDGPYQHLDHAKRCREAAQCGVVLRQFVQASLGRTFYCARILEAWDTSEGLEMWKLELLTPGRGLASVRADRVRQCSGIDALCTCAGEAGGQFLRSGCAQRSEHSREAKSAGLVPGFGVEGHVTCM